MSLIICLIYLFNLRYLHLVFQLAVINNDKKGLKPLFEMPYRRKPNLLIRSAYRSILLPLR